MPPMWCPTSAAGMQGVCADARQVAVELHQQVVLARQVPSNRVGCIKPLNMVRQLFKQCNQVDDHTLLEHLQNARDKTRQSLHRAIPQSKGGAGHQRTTLSRPSRKATRSSANGLSQNGHRPAVAAIVRRGVPMSVAAWHRYVSSSGVILD